MMHVIARSKPHQNPEDEVVMSRVVDHSQKTCFSIMPYGDAFKDIDDIIKNAAEECGLKYVRGDHERQPGSVMGHILHDIRSAAVVVADMTGHNPNVFYELGIAHQIKGPDRVVLITQKVSGNDAYDVHQFDQLVYAHHREGHEKLRKELPEQIRKAIASNSDQEYWNVIRGRLPRTRLIVRDLLKLANSPGNRNLEFVTIRIVAGLGSLAISDDEPEDASGDTEYWSLLIAERDALREVLVRGARLRAVLNPPRRFARSMLPGRLQKRYERLIRLVELRQANAQTLSTNPDLNAIRQCAFALTPIPMPNLFIIDDSVAYEGLKRGGTGGFDMTHCESSREGVLHLIAQFEQLFDESHREMINTHPPDGRLLEQLQAFYAEAMSLNKPQHAG